MTQMEFAKKGEITPQIKAVAKDEGISPEELAEKVAAGRVVIPANPAHRNLKPIGIGEGLRTKVNANIGTSMDFPHMEPELRKLEIALKAGADTVMDLSTGGNLNRIRRAIIERSYRPVGTVPIYQAAIMAISRRGSIVKMEVDDLFEAIEMHARDGVDFITVHAGLTLAGLEKIRRKERIMDIVSRGGAFIAGWMLHNEKENPLYTHYDRLLEIARRYDVTLSLGDGLRPGAIEDATDAAQITELMVLGELVERAREAGVQAMVEGPGHVPLDQIAMNVKLQKRFCKGAPFYVLGPLVTDIAPGYDHITSAIGGAVAAAAGADFLCYVTPAEHLGLPDEEAVKQGVIAARIAAHAADIVKGIKGAKEWDREMSIARRALDWKRQRELAIDKEMFDRIREARGTASEACSMCGDYCALKIVDEYLGLKREKYNALL